MLNDANAAAAENAKNADALIAAENARVEDAKKAAAAKITDILFNMFFIVSMFYFVYVFEIRRSAQDNNKMLKMT